jgi:hypothetical protein
MGVVMNMSNYEIERGSVGLEYSDEIMYAGWNPVVAMMYQHQPFVSTNKLTTDLAMVNVDLFMQRMYAYQR